MWSCRPGLEQLHASQYSLFLAFFSSFSSSSSAGPLKSWTWVKGPGAQRPELGYLFSCCSLWTLCAVLGAALLAIGNADRVERAAHNVITNSRQILHTAAADEHDRV